jgi:hypothetical protein
MGRGKQDALTQFSHSNGESSYTLEPPTPSQTDAREQSPLPGMPFLLALLEIITELITRGDFSNAKQYARQYAKCFSCLIPLTNHHSQGSHSHHLLQI